MDKIDRLEKRIRELESFTRLMKSNNEDYNKEAMIWRNLIPDQDGFEENFLKKYSKEAYQEKGFGEEFNELDFSDAVENEKSNDAVKRLHYWMDFDRKMIDLIVLNVYSDSEYWQELLFFVKQFIEYYQNAIVERILKEGKHYEGSGISHTWDKNNTIKWFKELYPSFSSKKKDVYNEIRRRHNPNATGQYLDDYGFPKNPTEKTIKNHLKRAKEEGKL